MNDFMAINWTSMIRPKALEVDYDSLRGGYGKFVAKPLERGYGLTLGNSLRRVLLSSLQGAGIVAVKIEGVDHEFGTINNVKEGVSEILLNLKEIQFELKDKNNVHLTLEKTGEGPVCASDFLENPSVTVVNPEHVIANISSGGSLKMEIKLARGKGYVGAMDNRENFELPVGWMYLDTLFSPVNRVNYSVTNSRVGKRTDYDKLTLEVWTDGAVPPVDAVAMAAKILKDQLTVFLNFEEEDEVTHVESKSQSSANSAVADYLMKSVSELELSVRSANCLQNANINFIYELVSKTEGEMLRTKNFGRKSLNEIKEILGSMGLGLGMKLDGLLSKEQLERINS